MHEWKKQPNDVGIAEFLWVDGTCQAWVSQWHDGIWVHTWGDGTLVSLGMPVDKKLHGPYESIEAAKLAAEMIYG